jgi:hypothetical protein
MLLSDEKCIIKHIYYYILALPNDTSSLLMMTIISQWTYDGKNLLEFERAVVVMHESLPWMLGEEEGLSGTSPVVARGGGMTDAVGRRWLVATTALALARASSCARETQSKVRMDAADCEAPDAFYRAEERGEFFNTFVSMKREEGATPISEGERST